MPYFTINDFAAGLDLRRSPLTAPGGTLRKLKNAHVTPGGEIEKRLSFVDCGELPSNYRGLVEMNGKLYSFIASGTDGTGGAIYDPVSQYSVGTIVLPVATLYEVIDWDVYLGKIFVTVWTDNAGNVKRIYDQQPINMAHPPTGLPFGFFCRAYKSKMYMVQGTTMWWSCLDDPLHWNDDATATPPHIGSGFIDMSKEDSDMEMCNALEIYYDKLAVMSERATQLWMIDPDPLKNQYSQTLRQAGTIAWRSALQYGSGDVLYVAPDGIRSLKARNSSLAAAVSDIGSPLDPIMQDLWRTMGQDWLSTAISIVQPVTGRFWVILKDRIYVLSAFPGPKISAWSEYVPMVGGSMMMFTPRHACTHLNTIVMLGDDHHVYAYGRDQYGNQNIYDSSPVDLEFPFHGGDNPATEKQFTGLDAAAAGDWSVYAAYNPENPTAEDYLGMFQGPSFEQGRFPMEGVATHMSLRLRHQAYGPATLSNLIIHYKVGKAD